MKSYRPHRFPPLPQAAPVAARATGSAVQRQSSLGEGFQQALDEGYRQGHASGLANGHAEGVAEGRAEGIAQGREQAREDVQAAFDQIAKPVDAVFDGLKRLQAEFQSAKRKEMVELVARVARQVIRCELTLQPVQLLALVDETLATLPPTREGGVEVYLNPEDLKRILEIDPKRFKRWTLLADPRLDAGECHVKAGDHEVDAGCNQRLDACMEQVSAQLLEVGEPQTEAVEVTP
jgi:flagellar assembly protein FliH